MNHAGRMVRREVNAGVAPRLLWDAWADPEKISGWWVDRAEGQAEPGATVTWCFDAFNYEFPVEVLAAEAPHRLAFKERIPGEMSRVLEIEIEANGDGSVLRLTQSGFPEGPAFDEDFAGCERGWELSLATLRHYVENHLGRPRESVLVMRPVAIEFDALARWFTTEEGLKGWLTTGGTFGDAGEPFELELWEGSRMSGAVLARPLPELLVSWNQINGAFTFKAFKMGPTQRMVGLYLTAWDMDEAKASEMAAWMEASLDRLVPLL